jgi:hypothetical protein
MPGGPRCVTSPRPMVERPSTSLSSTLRSNAVHSNERGVVLRLWYQYPSRRIPRRCTVSTSALPTASHPRTLPRPGLLFGEWPQGVNDVLPMGCPAQCSAFAVATMVVESTYLARTDSSVGAGPAGLPPARAAVHRRRRATPAVRCAWPEVAFRVEIGNDGWRFPIGDPTFEFTQGPFLRLREGGAALARRWRTTRCTRSGSPRSAACSRPAALPTPP